MILPVYLYNHPVLRQKAEPITDMDDATVAFIENMFDTMRNANGIGLAANQVGSTKAVTVIDAIETDDGESTRPMVLINPVIESMSDNEIDYEEGCLSLPDYRDSVTRPEAIQVRYLDQFMKEQTHEVDGFLARVMQHEIDHLNGIYFFERLSPLRRTLGKNKLKKIERGIIEPDYEYVLGK
ncbi:MAG: peptide deformylase [Candidatus Kapabacteria bacterium]|nr:peptide deformylase [Candidatus Kapabacteria bacterium]